MFADFFLQLFSPNGFPRRWECGPAFQNSPEIGWLHILSDLAIFLAYAAIPASLLFFILRRRDVPLRGIFWLFIAFILSCGLTHATDALMFAYPIYRFLGVMKFITAVVSLTTVVALLGVIPEALKIPGMHRELGHLRQQTTAQQLTTDGLATERNRLEERNAAIARREHSLRQAFQAVETGFALFDAATGRFLWEIGISECLDRLYPPIGTGRHGWNDWLAPDQLQRVLAAAAHVAADRRTRVVSLPSTLAPGANLRAVLSADPQPSIDGTSTVYAGCRIWWDGAEEPSVFE